MGKSLKKNEEIDTLRPNAFGLHHVHGNVAEWCADAYVQDFYHRPEASRRNPLSEKGGTQVLLRVLRGGSWASPAWACRSAARDGVLPDRHQPLRGLRPAFFPLR